MSGAPVVVRHTSLTSTLSLALAAAFSNQPPTGHASSHVHITSLATAALLRYFYQSAKKCGTI